MTDHDIVDLGVASAETRGGKGMALDEQFGDIPFGLSAE
ncbi:benenodin family lasso peptide [Sphingomonas sp.]|jgi:hypothetical protein|nr:benenodin family lasso peptide [Sphingomonas sp.]HEX4693593.1 benenodin family lasso peptide [Sphingomonas sp.]